MHNLKFPAFLTIRNANFIIQKCEEAFLSGDKKVCFDLSRCSFSDPFGTTLVAGAMIACIKRGHDVVFSKTKNNRLEQHFKRIGFYEFGKIGEVGKSKYSGTQVELKYLTALDPTYTSAVIQVLEGSLKMSQGVKDSLHVCINELMTNTFDHSGTILGCFVCVQTYTYKGQIAICLTDFGRGILRTLSAVQKYAYLNNSLEAIELAIQNGVTSRDIRAGLGLDHIHRFLRTNNGQIHIISGDGWVHWNYQNGNGVVIKRKKLDIEFEGTIVNIVAKADGEGFYILASENKEEQIF